MNYTISIKNTSHRVPYSMIIGPYTRKSDAIRGLSKLNLPNMSNANMIITTSENGNPVYCETITKMTAKTITTRKINYRTFLDEGESTYKFNY